MKTCKQYLAGAAAISKFWYNLQTKRLLPIMNPKDHHGDFATKNPSLLNISPGVAAAIKRSRSQSERASHPEVLKQNIRVSVLRGKSIFLDFVAATNATLHQAQDLLMLLREKGHMEQEVTLSFQRQGEREAFNEYVVTADDVLAASHWPEVTRPFGRRAA